MAQSLKNILANITSSYGNANVANYLPTFNGNLTSGNANLGNLITANYHSGNGSLLTSLTGANVTGYVSNANIANTAYAVTAANVSGLGNIATINKDGNASNILYGNGAFAAAPAAGTNYANSNVATFLASYGSNTITTTGNVSVGNIIGNGQALTGLTGANVTGQVGNALVAGTVYTAAQTNITSVGTLTSLTSGTHTISANANIAMSGSLSQISGGNLVSASYITGTLTTTAQPNITSVGTLTSLAVTGNITSGNANLGNLLTANYHSGNGSLLTSITGANVSGYVPNANIANTAYAVAVANVTGIGNIATINKDGNASNILYGNGVFAAPAASSSYANSNVATFLASYGSNTISTTGNISAGNLSATTAVIASTLTSNVATGTAPLTVTSTTRVSNLNVAYANVTDYVGTGSAVNGNFNITLQSGTSGNIQPLGNSAFIANATSGTLYATLFTGTLTTASQPNITSHGSLIGLTVSNATGVVNFTTTANVTLGNVSNLHISGGTSGQVLTTDGSGGLSWTTSSGASSTPDILSPFLFL
jgi:hypothetical protein